MAESDAPSIRFCRLPVTFAADALARDLPAIAEGDWVAHFNAGYHDGGWSGVTLRGVGGNARQLFPGDAQAASYADTPLRARCPHIDAALAHLLCPVGPVRLLRLSAGGIIREHRDAGLHMELGLARLHVPILTGSDVEFYLDNDRVTMAPGECWYLNFDLPHRVQNLGNTDRVHLVIDCTANDWLRQHILTAAAAISSSVPDSSQTRFEQFRALVLGDPSMIEALYPIDQPDVFVTRVVDLGRQHGFRFTAQEVTAAMRVGARIGAGRWIVG
jgi:hypothetical protein